MSEDRKLDNLEQKLDQIGVSQVCLSHNFRLVETELRAKISQLRQDNAYLFTLVSLALSSGEICVVTPPDGVSPSVDGKPVTFQGDLYDYPRTPNDIPISNTHQFASFHPAGLKGSTEFKCSLQYHGGITVLAPLG